MIFWLEWKIILNIFIFYLILMMESYITAELITILTQRYSKHFIILLLSPQTLLSWYEETINQTFSPQIFSISLTWGRSSSIGSSVSMLAKVTLLCLSSFLGVQSGRAGSAGGQPSRSFQTSNTSRLISNLSTSSLIIIHKEIYKVLKYQNHK